MVINKFITELRKALAKDLPSVKAHLRMMPSSRKLDLLYKPVNEFTRLSSVLILLYERNDELYTVFIKRQEYEGVHSGQIAFPGGKQEKSDKNLIQTAVREANEEIGIDTSTIEILGQLSELYIPPSNFIVFPIVAYTSVLPVFKLDEKEVSQIIEVSLHELLATSNISSFEFNGAEQKKITAPCFVFSNHRVWGATAMIVSELQDVVKSVESYEN
jgi:8-oxo-dGTP pyrophosphatase MutT (NUDIX family)